MTKRGLVSLIIKMAGIILLVHSIPSLLQFGRSLPSLADIGYPLSFYYLIASVLSFIVFASLMYVVIRFSDSLSDRLIAEDQLLFPLANLTSSDIQALAFSWIGLLFLLWGFSGIISNLVYLMRLKAAMGPEEVKMANVNGLVANTVSNASEMILGACLFLYPKGISRLWHSIQGMRTSDKAVQRDV